MENKDFEQNQEYYENLDKRTKEYKAYSEWKAKYDSQTEGLGDVVEKFTTATGIKKAVEFVAGEDCGCDQRKEALNRLFPKRKPKCLTEDEYLFLNDLFASENMKVSQRSLLNIYNRVFRVNFKPTNCSACVKRWYDELKKYFDKYSE